MSAKALALPLKAVLRLSPFRWLLRVAALSRSRRQLLRLDDHLLRDIGLTGEQATREAIRPVWDAPLHWRDPKA